MRPLMISIFAAALLSSPLSGQSKPAQQEQQQRESIVAFVRSYVDANNRADVDAMVAMMSRNPNASGVTLGVITRGWEALRAQADSSAGLEGTFRLALGSLDVTPLGNGHALVLSAVTLTVETEQGPVQVRGAWSLVLERAAGGWKILHGHVSLPLE